MLLESLKRRSSSTIERFDSELSWPVPSALARHLDRGTGVSSDIAEIASNDRVGSLTVHLVARQPSWWPLPRRPLTLRVWFLDGQIVVAAPGDRRLGAEQRTQREIGILMFDLIEARRCLLF